MIKHFFTNEQLWLDKWDDFLKKSDRGLYNQLSSWIKFYEVYGFETTFYIITKDDSIVGGCAIVIAKFSLFKFYIIPCGPVLIHEFEYKLDFIIEQLQMDASKRGCCYFQLSIPFLKNQNLNLDYTLQNLQSDSIYFSGNTGTRFKHVIPLYGMRLTNLENKSYNQVYDKFSSNHKRNIQKTKSENFIFKFISSSNEIEEAYQCFVLNSIDKGYPIRSFDSMQNTLQDFINNDVAKIGCCFLDNKIIGAVYVMKTGNRLIYINGGVLKEHQHQRVSHFMHNELIKYSIEQNYKSYDISVGGSLGVINFKEGFATELYEFIETRYWVLRPKTFKMYELIEQKLKKHKSKIAYLLQKFKKVKRNYK